MSILNKLTEGIVDRDLAKEGAALQSKWAATGLLEGITNERERASMSRLLENQAKELLREATTMASGDVEGFAAVAFPIVRRVFGGLLANDLVSVQPMSLPAGLIFFLDFTFASSRYDLDGDSVDGIPSFEVGKSVYGGGVVAKGIQTGVTDLTGSALYNLQVGYASATGSVMLTDGGANAVTNAASAHFYDGSSTNPGQALTFTPVAISALTEAQKKQLRFDPDVLAQTSTTRVFTIVVGVADAVMSDINKELTTALNLTQQDGTALDDGGGTDHIRIIRRLTEYGYRDANGIVDGSKDNYITFYAQSANTSADNVQAAALALHYPVADSFDAGGAVGAVVGATDWPLELATNTRNDAGSSAEGEKDIIPEIDIKVDSIAVTAVTKKLKAKWSPELGQDLNAYHNLDAEVELTSILSEQIALEIDREIVNDLIKGATAGTYYWSRSPGLFVNRTSGAELGATAAAPDFTGTVSEWYETLIETINDVSAQIHRKTLRGGANFLVTSPEVANILEFTAGFRASVTHDEDRGTVGAVKVGALSKKFDVYIDPYFPRNLILIGRKGGSFLESGFVYAPYVPLQVTPTIFGTEDFVPRKGVMTRYAKKMVRPDMYGLVVVRGLLGESGAS